MKNELPRLEKRRFVGKQGQTTWRRADDPPAGSASLPNAWKQWNRYTEKEGVYVQQRSRISKRPVEKADGRMGGLSEVGPEVRLWRGIFKHSSAGVEVKGSGGNAGGAGEPGGQPGNGADGISAAGRSFNCWRIGNFAPGCAAPASACYGWTTAFAWSRPRGFTTVWK